MSMKKFYPLSCTMFVRKSNLSQRRKARKGNLLKNPFSIFWLNILNTKFSKHTKIYISFALKFFVFVSRKNWKQRKRILLSQKPLKNCNILALLIILVAVCCNILVGNECSNFWIRIHCFVVLPCGINISKNVLKRQGWIFSDFSGSW